MGLPGPKVIVLSCGCYWDTTKAINLGELYSCHSEGHGWRTVVQVSDQGWFWRHANNGA